VPRSCPCGEGYNPAGIMRYCPRAACKRWLHERCLKLATSEHYPVGKSRDEVFEQMTSRSEGDTEREEEEAEAEDEWRQAIPALLRALARERIVRGGVHGLVGNADAVLKAREILRTGEVPRDWETFVGQDALRRVQLTSGHGRKRTRLSVSKAKEKEEAQEESGETDYWCLWCRKVI